MLKNKPVITIILILFIFLGVYLIFLYDNDNPNPTTPPTGEVTLGAEDLQGKLWEWVKTEGVKGTTTVLNPQSYTLTYNSDTEFDARIDCNSGSGKYTVSDEGSINMELQITTLAFCGPPSRHDDMVTMMSSIGEYRFEDGGDTLVLIWSETSTQEYFRNAGLVKDSNPGESSSGTTDEIKNIETDPQNTTYLIEGQKVTLSNGKAEEQIPGSSTIITTEIWGTPEVGDLTGDGVEDAAVILVQQPGGSGTFYYVAASLNVDDGYVGTDAILLGDRVAMQTFGVKDGTGQLIFVNYAERAEDEPMSAQPSVGVSRLFEISGQTLVEVDK